MKRAVLIGLASNFLLSMACLSQTITIGFTVSQTGKLSVDSQEQLNGFELWRDQVNASGGIEAGGKHYKLRFVKYDDASSPQTVPSLYEQLITADKSDFLFSPYSSALTASAAPVTERYGKIMITTGAAEDTTYKQGNKYLYQMFTPATEYLSSALNAIKTQDPNSSLAFLCADDSFSTLVAREGKARAWLAGMKVVSDQAYNSENSDFEALVNKLRGANPSVLIGGGHYNDGIALARQLRASKVNLKTAVLLVAPDSPRFAELGDAAYGVIVPSQWEPAAAFKPQVGPTGPQFVKAYLDRYNTMPSYESAGAYATGLVLQHAIEAGGPVNTAAVASTLDAMDITTFFGRTKFSTAGSQHGLQVMHVMVLAQWQKDRSGKLVKQVIWPEAAKTAAPVFYIK
jgi:branched-chain amino acid transport system substrate-binding protein